ncbi:WD40-like Beta Propeller Repeat [Micromonospora inositola]|uniref:WD40-like Beta Propeller Repeat n=2 Tax=Micromonospora inositola TaxID=47865 RepID=A0A1C5HV90_9ACTN|nr:WD40-like Beta Propeller Repeat [Micromonospora inositola]
MASVLATAAVTFTVGPAPALASTGVFANPFGLTSSNASDSITFSDGRVLTNSTGEKINYASWSPDGSRAAFVNQDGAILTLRYDDPDDVHTVVWPETDTVRRDPQWIGRTDQVMWAAKPLGRPWRIESTSNLNGIQTDALNPDDGWNYTNPDSDNAGHVVVQRQQTDGAGNPTGVPEIGMLTDGRFEAITTNASNPTISPDGRWVAFVRDGDIWNIYPYSGSQNRITANGGSHDDPHFSPDGTYVMFTQTVEGSGTPVVAIAYGIGGTQDLIRVIDGLSGVPAYQPQAQDRTVRVAGQDRFGTAVAASQAHWGKYDDPADVRPRAGAVVLSRSDTYADALGGSALAAAKKGPLLLTPPTALQPQTADEIRRVLPAGGTVYLLGSEGALSNTVRDAVARLGFKVVRLAGADRFGTSIAIANAIDSTPDQVLVATGMNFPDALAAGAAAGSRNRPGTDTSAVVVLTNDDKLPPAIKAYLDAREIGGSELIAVGKQAATAIDPYPTINFAGQDRFETASAVNVYFFGRGGTVGLATGMDWPDALAGGALMATLNGPLMLTFGTQDTLHPKAKTYADLLSGSIDTAVVFGSAAVVSEPQAAELGKWISGPMGSSMATNGTYLK